MTTGNDQHQHIGVPAIEEQVITLIRPFAGKSKKITPSARLFHDLGIGGDDASDLLESVAKHFGTSFADMDFGAFFSNEGESSIYYWFMRIGLFRSQIRSMTVAHLVAVVSRGSWFEPPTKPAWALSMKPTVSYNVPADRESVTRILGKRLGKLYSPNLAISEFRAVVCFPRAKVIVGGDVKRALNQLHGGEGQVLLAASEFTKDARAIGLHASCALVAEKEIFWSDADFIEVKGGGAR
jgi:hypothetical protein